MAILVNQNLGVHARVVGGLPGSPYFFRQILSDMDTIFQWQKFKFQNKGEMTYPNIQYILPQLQHLRHQAAY